MPRPYTDMPPTGSGTAWGWRSVGAVVFVCATIICDHLHNLRFGVPWVRGGRSRQSGSMVVYLEVFTKWARHASPLHRYAPYWTGIVCVGVSGRRSRSPLCIVGVNLRNLRFDFLCPEHSRSTIGVDGSSLGGLYNLGEACLAPTQSGTAWGWRSVGAAVFVCATKGRSAIICANLRYLWFHLQIGKSPCAIHRARALQVGNRLHSGAHVLMLDKMVWCRAAAKTVPSESFSGIRPAVGAQPGTRP